jgi:hypothetical protein
MLCPTCANDLEPAAVARDIRVCSFCGETVADRPSGLQKAAYADVQGLSDAEFTALRKAKAKVVASKPR